ncbi:MAG: choice-of-anchor D domain-containing protein [Myxococcales bacterium]|nr:choice-of-anchor D domain-containing protein [Myxococcales bacterium]
MPQPLVRWVLLMAFLGVSCGRTELWPSGSPRGELTLAWDDEQGVSHRTRALEAAPGRAEFGDVVSGGRATRVVRAENTGTGPLVLERVVTLPGSADAFVATWTPETLAPGASQQIALSFAPRQADVRAQARFRFIASNVEPGGESIDLLARGQSPAVEAAVPDLAVTPFPRVELGRVAWRDVATTALRSELRLANAGKGSLRLTAPWSVAGVRGDADELCVGALELPSRTCRSTPPPEYEPARGLLANEAMQVSLWLSPRTPGLKAWTLTLFSNDPDEPAKEVEVVAEVMPDCVATVTPGALDFGVLGTTPRELTVEVRNRSQMAGAVCQLSGLRLGAGSDSVFSLVGAPPNASIDPGQSLRLSVRAWSRAAPPTRRRVTGSVELEFANAPTPTHTVPLAATLGRSCLTLSPTELDFGSLRAGCASGARRVTLINSCPGPLTVHGVDLVAATSIGPEYQLKERPSLPLTLPASATATVELEYRPADLGEDRAALRVRAEFNHETFDELSMLAGRGAAGPENVDTFRQGVPRADVLLVIDDSCSMADKQRALAANLDSFLNELRPNRVDFRIGVVTTTMALDGGASLVRSPGGQPYLESATPMLEQAFRQLVSVGISGDAIESCLHPAVDVLSGADEFLRDGAALSVICVSDAPDQAPLSTEHYWSQLVRAKSSFTYNVVGPFLPSPPAGCIYDTGSELFSQGRHEEVVRRSGGVLGEICSSDWGRTLAQVGGAVAGIRSSFQLKAEPALTNGRGLSVLVDAALVPPIDSRGAVVWTYSAAKNSIDFTELYKPPFGSLVEVRYEVPCRP